MTSILDSTELKAGDVVSFKGTVSQYQSNFTDCVKLDIAGPDGGKFAIDVHGSDVVFVERPMVELKYMRRYRSLNTFGTYIYLKDDPTTNTCWFWNENSEDLIHFTQKYVRANLEPFD